MPLASLHLSLYLFWLRYVGLRTLLLSVVFSFIFSVSIYIFKGANTLNEESYLALQTIFTFSFPVFFSLSLILMLLLVFKKVFYQKVGKWQVFLYDCKDECIEEPLLSDVTMLWRKWLFVSLWVILVFLVLFMGLYQLVMDEFPIYLINGWSLTGLISIFGGFVFSFGLSKCKKVRIKDV